MLVRVKTVDLSNLEVIRDSFYHVADNWIQEQIDQNINQFGLILNPTNDRSVILIDAKAKIAMVTYFEVVIIKEV